MLSSTSLQIIHLNVLIIRISITKYFVIICVLIFDYFESAPVSRLGPLSWFIRVQRRPLTLQTFWLFRLLWNVLAMKIWKLSFLVYSYSISILLECSFRIQPFHKENRIINLNQLIAFFVCYIINHLFVLSRSLTLLILKLWLT